MTTTRYLDETDYAALLVAVKRLLAGDFDCDVTGKTDDSEIRMALGEIADIWPESILPDVAASLDREASLIRQPIPARY